MKEGLLLMETHYPGLTFAVCICSDTLALLQAVSILLLKWH